MILQLAGGFPLQVAYPGIIITGGVVSHHSALLYDDGGEVSSLTDTVSYAAKQPKQAPSRGNSSTRKWYRARWVGLVISVVEHERARSPEGGPSGAPDPRPMDGFPHHLATPATDGLVPSPRASPMSGGTCGEQTKS